MSANNNPNRTAALALNQKIASGVDKYFSKLKSFSIDGTTYTPAGLKAVLQAEDDAANSADSTRAQLKQEVATHRTAKANAVAVRGALRSYILGAFGKKAVQMLADFGMVPPRYTGNKTAAVKAEAAAKAEATRKARSTASAPQEAATTTSSSQGAPAIAPVPVAQAQLPAQSTATHS